MNRTLVIALLALLATGCGDGKNAREKAAADAQDVARVEAVQEAVPPIEKLTLDAITFTDIGKANVFGAGCAFLPEGRQDEIVALARDETAILKVDGDLRIYASDRGSMPLPLGGWTRYEGKEHVVDIQAAGGKGARTDQETIDWPGRLTIRDPYDRVVYSAVGTLQCGT